MSFFRFFPLIDYSIQDDGNFTEIVDIFRNVDMNDILADDITTYQFYHILDGERPDILAQKLYKNAGYYWTFFIANDSLKGGLRNWPLSYEQFENEMEERYDSYGELLLTPSVVESGLYYINADTFYEPYDFMRSNIGSLDLSYINLKVKRIVSTEDSENPTASIVQWNPNTLTLRVSDFSDRAKFFENDTDPLQFYIDFEAEDFEEDDTFINWMEEFYQWYTNWLISDLSAVTLPIDEFNQKRIDFGADKAGFIAWLIVQWNTFFSEPYAIDGTQSFPIIQFDVRQVWDNSRNAPRYYTDSVGGDEIDALVAIENDNLFPVNNYDYDDEVNTANSRIRIIQPSHIEAFVEEYKALIKE